MKNIKVSVSPPYQSDKANYISKVESSIEFDNYQIVHFGGIQDEIFAVPLLLGILIIAVNPLFHHFF